MILVVSIWFLSFDRTQSWLICGDLVPLRYGSQWRLRGVSSHSFELIHENLKGTGCVYWMDDITDSSSIVLICSNSIMTDCSWLSSSIAPMRFKFTADDSRFVQINDEWFLPIAFSYAIGKTRDHALVLHSLSSVIKNVSLSDTADRSDEKEKPGNGSSHLGDINQAWLILCQYRYQVSD